MRKTPSVARQASARAVCYAPKNLSIDSGPRYDDGHATGRGPSRIPARRVGPSLPLTMGGGCSLFVSWRHTSAGLVATLSPSSAASPEKGYSFERAMMRDCWRSREQISQRRQDRSTLELRSDSTAYGLSEPTMGYAGTWPRDPRATEFPIACYRRPLAGAASPARKQGIDDGSGDAALLHCLLQRI